MSDVRDIVGYAAGLLATAAFVPQVAKSFKARSTPDISLGMYLLFCAGVGLWLLYGLLISSWPVVASNAVTLALSGAVLILKFRENRQCKQIAAQLELSDRQVRRHLTRGFEQLRSALIS